jgi:hypothetical protein
MPSREPIADLSKFAAIATPLDKPKVPQMPVGVPVNKIQTGGGVMDDGRPIVVLNVYSPAGVFTFHLDFEKGIELGKALYSMKVPT